MGSGLRLLESSASRFCVAATLIAASLSASCGDGSVGTSSTASPTQTYLSVAADDPDGDTLHYAWRVTGGTIDNKDANETVWTLPDGPGLHFAYVMVSDGKGGYAEHQYAVSSDATSVGVPTRTPLTYPTVASTKVASFPEVAPTKISVSVTGLKFKDVDGSLKERYIYWPGVNVTVGGKTGTTDLGGLVSLPNTSVDRVCTSPSGAVIKDCVTPADSQNLRLYGHVGFTDGGICGNENDYFGVLSSATVQLQQRSDGAVLSPPVRVNRYGDYIIDAAVAVDAELKVAIKCEAYSASADVPATAGTTGYSADAPVEVSVVLSNARPLVRKMVALGADGNVRGKSITSLQGGSSGSFPGNKRFLTYKGADTKQSACNYYVALGAADSCDSQGNLVNPISFEDWKKTNKFDPYRTASDTQPVEATYINKMDLNLVRRMVGTENKATGALAFYVCNHPGPDGTSQAEVDDLIATALRDEKRVACVAMELSKSAGAAGGAAFTKFLTFGPDGSLLQSVNLDGRGEKYMPGACVACHGGSNYNGRFAEKGLQSPDIGSRFLPFDTSNYFFSSGAALTEPSQTPAIYQLNQWVKKTEEILTSPDGSLKGKPTGTLDLINKGWYGIAGTKAQMKDYVPDAWKKTDDSARIYKEVIATSCRTCHTAFVNLNWDVITVNDFVKIAKRHICGGGPDVAVNNSMPNALMSHDRLYKAVQADPKLAKSMDNTIGCSKPLSDPVYPAK